VYFLGIGLHEVSYLCTSSYIWWAFLVGVPLVQLKKEIDDIEELLNFTEPMICLGLAVNNLIDENTQNPAMISGEGFDLNCCLKSNENPVNKLRCLLNCGILAYLFYDYSLALKFVDCCRPLAIKFRMGYMYPCFLFYDGLVLLQAARSNSALEWMKKKYISIAKENIFVLRQFSQNAAQNYLNKVSLLEAELQAIQGNKAEALSCYQQAIALSSKHGFLLEHALSCERRAIFYLNSNSIESATESLQDSYLNYKKWGSERKLKHLSDTYPVLVKKMQDTSSVGMELNLEDRSLASVSILTFFSGISASSGKKRKSPSD